MRAQFTQRKSLQIGLLHECMCTRAESKSLKTGLHENQSQCHTFTNAILPSKSLQIGFTEWMRAQFTQSKSLQIGLLHECVCIRAESKSLKTGLHENQSQCHTFTNAILPSKSLQIGLLNGCVRNSPKVRAFK